MMLPGSGECVAESVDLTPDGFKVWVYPLTFGRARLVVGAPGSPTLLDGF